MLHIIEHTFTDTVTLVPFLFITYLLMEYLEEKVNPSFTASLSKAGRFGPLLGGILGIIPQCGFSAVAANFYACGLISVGTLLAIFFSTSDEMLPILLSSDLSNTEIFQILGIKVLIAVIAGFLVDRLWKSKTASLDPHIHDLCEQESCHCEHGVLRSALTHTCKVTIFIFIVTFVLNLLLHNGGEELLEHCLKQQAILGPVIAGIVGLIPNCASSVVLTKLFVSGALTFGSMMSGLLVNAGIGLLVLIRIHPSKKEIVKIVALLYTIGVGSGILLQFFPF